MAFLKNLQAFTILFLIASSTITFPALAAEQLSTVVNNDFSSDDLLDWFRDVFAKLFKKDHKTFNEISTPSVGTSSSVGNFIQSLKNLELASNEYKDHFDAGEYSSNFLQSSSDFISSSEKLIAELEQRDSSTANELQQKISAFTEKVKTIKQKAEKRSVTQEDLKRLINDISNARGKRYEKVEFDRYVEREIRPRVLGIDGGITVAGGQIILPSGVNSSTPLPEDYLESPDAPITPEIQALADSLGNDPARIYWWVHENIRYVPYYGAMHGAQQTLISRSGNDIDTASLLIALLRASGYPARYVYGIAQTTRNETFDLLGVSDVPGALRLLWGTGIPAEFDGVGFKIERVWVEVYAPIYPFLERRHWIQLDAAWKKAGNYTKIDEYLSVNSTVNATELYDGATENATINETEGYIYGINTTFIEEYLNSTVNVTELQNITEEFFIPNETQIGERYFPLSMQFGFNKSYEYSLLPDELKYKVSLYLTNTGNTTENSSLVYENNLTEIVGKPFVLDFAPSTQEDADKLENGSYPAYEINMTPMLYLNDTHVNGTNVTYGSDLKIALAVWLLNPTLIAKGIYAGEKTAIVMDAPRTEYLAYNQTFERIRSLETLNDNETLFRQSLYLIGLNFFINSDLASDTLSDELNSSWARTMPAVAFVMKENKVESFEGVPLNVSSEGTSIDLKFDQIVSSLSRDESIAFNTERGFIISSLESSTIEAYYNITAVSTSKILYQAIVNNITIYTINQSNIDVLESLNISTGDKEIIKSLLNNSEYGAIVPAQEVQLGNWSGIGYAILDLSTGSGKFLISGGLAGGKATEETPSHPFGMNDCEWAAIKIPIYFHAAVLFPPTVIFLAGIAGPFSFATISAIILVSTTIESKFMRGFVYSIRDAVEYCT